MSLFVGDPPRIKALNGFLLAILTGLLALPLLGGVRYVQFLNAASIEDGTLFDEIASLVGDDGTIRFSSARSPAMR